MSRLLISAVSEFGSMTGLRSLAVAALLFEALAS